MNTAHLTIRVPEKLLQTLDSMAAQSGVNRSKLIKAILEAATAQYVEKTPEARLKAVKGVNLKTIPLRLPAACLEALDSRAASAMVSKNTWMSGLVQRELQHGEHYFPADVQALEVARATLVDTARELRTVAGAGAKRGNLIEELREAWGVYSQLLSEIVNKARGR